MTKTYMEVLQELGAVDTTTTDGQAKFLALQRELQSVAGIDAKAVKVAKTAENAEAKALKAKQAQARADKQAKLLTSVTEKLVKFEATLTELGAKGIKWSVGEGATLVGVKGSRSGNGGYTRQDSRSTDELARLLGGDWEAKLAVAQKDADRSNAVYNLRKAALKALKALPSKA